MNLRRLVVVSLVALLAASAPLHAEDVAPGALPVVVAKQPKKRDRDALRLAAFRLAVVQEIAAARPDVVDLAEGEEPVIGRPANGVETLVSTYQGLATHLVSFEAKGKGRGTSLTVRVIAVDAKKTLMSKTVRPFRGSESGARAAVVSAVLGALPMSNEPSPPVDEASPGPASPMPAEAPVASAAAAPPAPPAPVGAPVEAPVDAGVNAPVDDETTRVWPYVTGGVVAALAALSASLLIGGAVVGTLAWLDSTAYVDDPSRADLKESSLVKSNVADVLYVGAGLAALAGGVALGVGLIIGFSDDE